MAIQQALERLAQILQDVEAVGDLYRLGYCHINPGSSDAARIYAILMA